MTNLVYEGFKKIRMIPMGLSMFLMTGCSSVDTQSDLYQRIKMQTDQFANATAQTKDDSVVYLTEQIYDACRKCQAVGPYIFALSIVIGVLLLHLVSEDQGIRQKAIGIFLVGIPFLVGLFTFVVPWLVGTYL